MALTQVTSAMMEPNAQFMGFKNRIINGAMMIDQRNAGATLSLATTAAALYAVDRFQAYQDKSGVTGTVGQSTDAPAGFKNSFAVTITTGATSGAAYQSFIQQGIEGLNVADLAWGTASAQPITVSFWVKSSITGTNGFSVSNSAANRVYVGSYTINSANTWEYKTVTIAGDTSGTWLTTNGFGIRIRFNIGSGSNFLGSAGSWGTSIVNGPTGAFSTTGTSGASLYITGIQLEKGSTATSFDYRPYGTELALCQRYCLVYSNDQDGSVRWFGFNYNTTTALAQVYFPVQTRTRPTGITASTASGFTLYSAGTSFSMSAVSLDNSSNKTANVSITSSGLTQGGGCILGFQTTGNKIEFTGMEL